MIIIILITISLISLGYYAFINLGKWLVVKDPIPDKLDVIFAFGGKGRLKYAKELFKNNPNSILVFNSKKWEEKLNNLTLEDLDTNRIIGVYVRNGTFLNINTNKRSGTYLEVSFIISWLRESIKAVKFITGKQTNDLSKKSTTVIVQGGNLLVGLVSDSWHMRRINYLVERKKGDLKCNFFYLPVPIKENTYYYWWHDKKLAKSMSNEIIKIIYSIF